jgi:hypothetical protein
MEAASEKHGETEINTPALYQKQKNEKNGLVFVDSSIPVK